MNIMDLMKEFPTQEACLKRLELARWYKGRRCPYCFSEKTFKYKNALRYHCNDCNTSFTVTVNTIFHNTKLPLRKWFLAISLIMNAKKGISAKQLQRDLKVTYKTAWYMAMRIRRAMLDHVDMLMGIIERVDHSLMYSYNDINTNTIESFWALLKRGVIGQFHKVSEKFLPLYLAEFCYRFNQRRQDMVFENTLLRCAGEA
jgi:transposase-like protein